MKDAFIFANLRQEKAIAKIRLKTISKLIYQMRRGFVRGFKRKLKSGENFVGWNRAALPPFFAQ